MKIYVEKLNHVHLRVYSDDLGVEEELVQFFTYKYPGAEYTPKFKARLWDGMIRVLDPVRKTLYVGLLPYVYKFAKERGYPVECKNEVEISSDVSLDDVVNFIGGLSPASKGSPVQVRDYQIDAVYTAIAKERTLLLSPTASGKSLIIYSIVRWHLHHSRKVIIVVPSTALVEQLYSDFEDYSSLNGWSVSDNCQKLYSGFSKDFNKNVLVTTWQSSYQQHKQWFKQFDVIIGDEAHQFQSKSLTSIMEKMDDVQWRVGTTGTINNKKVHQLILEGVFGELHRVTQTSKLMEEGHLVKLSINCIILKYDELTRKRRNKNEYDEEMSFIIAHEKRNNFIKNLSLRCKGNTLILFQFVEDHGEVLYDMIRSSTSKERAVYFIHGGVSTQDREKIREELSRQTDAIIIASYGVYSTGINIPSIENIIFSSPSKSKIRNLQSIGRGLRLNSGKTKCVLYDIADDLHWKSWKNHGLNHLAERVKIYAAENFDYKLIEVDV